MKLSLGPTLALALAVAVPGLAVMACADSDARPVTMSSDAGSEAGLPGLPDGELEDASADAGPRTCSIHGFCRTALPGDETLRGVWGDGTGVAWAISEEGHVLRWDGSTWKVHASDLGALLTIWGVGATDIWIGGEKGLFHGTGASSATLAFQPSTTPGAPVRITSIWAASANDVWAVGTSEADGGVAGRVLHYTNVWQADAAEGQNLAFTHVWGSAGSGVWLGGTRPIPDEAYSEMIVLRRKGGTTFTAVTMPDDGLPFPLGTLSSIHGAAAVGDSLVWVNGRSTVGHPGLWKGTSTDGGGTFTFEYIRDGVATDPQLHALWAPSPNEAWAAGEFGRVRRWNGTEWATIAISTTNLPVPDPFYGVWSGGASEVWAVGKQMALRYDAAQAKDGGAR